MTKPLENQHFDRKPIRKVIGQTADRVILSSLIFTVESPNRRQHSFISDNSGTPPLLVGSNCLVVVSQLCQKNLF